jgi:hypothetical protein
LGWRDGWVVNANSGGAEPFGPIGRLHQPEQAMERLVFVGAWQFAQIPQQLVERIPQPPSPA